MYDYYTYGCKKKLQYAMFPIVTGIDVMIAFDLEVW